MPKHKYPLNQRCVGKLYYKWGIYSFDLENWIENNVLSMLNDGFKLWFFFYKILKYHEKLDFLVNLLVVILNSQDRSY